MVFWIVLSVIVLAIVISAVVSARMALDNSYYDFWELFGPPLAVIVLFSVFIGTAIVGIGSSSNLTEKAYLSKTYELRALVTKDSQESSGSATFFLGFGSGSGSSGTVTSVSYIRTAKDGGSTLHREAIDESVIYEDVPAGGKPYVEDYVHVSTNPGHVWVPWDIRTVGDVYEHRFHIPEDTILEKYEVTP